MSRPVELVAFRLADPADPALRAAFEAWLAARQDAAAPAGLVAQRAATGRFAQRSLGPLCPCCVGQIAARAAVAALLREQPAMRTVWVELPLSEHAAAAGRALAAGLTGAELALRYVLVAAAEPASPDPLGLPDPPDPPDPTAPAASCTPACAPAWELLELPGVHRAPGGVGRPPAP